MEKIFAPVAAFVCYSLFTALLGRATAFAPTSVVVAIYATTVAILGWTSVYMGSAHEKMSTMSMKQLGFIVLIGIIIFIADYSYVRSFEIKVHPTIIFGLIACIAMGAMALNAFFAGEVPSKQELLGVSLCCIGAFVIYTAKQ